MTAPFLCLFVYGEAHGDKRVTCPCEQNFAPHIIAFDSVRQTVHDGETVICLVYFVTSDFCAARSMT